MSKYKAIIFDVDGVAVGSPRNELPSERLAEAVRAVQPVYYMSAATGRAWSWAKGTFEYLSLDDPCIVAAGTQIRNPKSGEILWQCDMDAQYVAAIMKILAIIPDCKLLYNDYDGDEYYAGGVSPTEIHFSEPVHFLNCIFVPEDQALSLMDKLAVIENLAITLAISQRDGYKDILITHKSATKEHAVAELLKLVGVDPGDATGIGDGHNDIDLFKAVGRKVAMGNGVPELKEAADEVIGGVAEDGFAKFLEEIA